MTSPRRDDDRDPKSLPLLRIGDISLEVNPRRWLVEGLWGASCVGFLAGSPKSCKSFLGLDMAVSVATGTACLSRYSVDGGGTVLAYLAEDNLPDVRERVEGITRHRGLDLRQIDLHLITSSNLRLDRGVDRERLRETVRAVRPRLLLLDPLVRMHSLDENCSTAIAGLLSYFRELQRSFDLSVVIVHHTRKSGSNGSQGQALRGSGDLYAFFDSALYLRRVREELILSVEHRAAAAPGPVRLELDLTDEDAIHLEVRGQAIAEKGRRERNLERAVLEVLGEHQVLNRGELRKALGVKNERLGDVLESLEEKRILERSSRGWRLLAKRGQDRSRLSS